MIGRGSMDVSGATEFTSSSFCGSSSCVQVGFRPDDRVAVRDGKRPTSRNHTFSNKAWQTFLEALRTGKFDR
jgi:hypothetical protein